MSQSDLISTVDAARNRAEHISRAGDATDDAGAPRRSVEMIWDFWRRRPGNVVVPGHDLPMTQVDGRTRYIGQREAAITAWYGDGLGTTTLIELATVRAAAILTRAKWAGALTSGCGPRAPFVRDTESCLLSAKLHHGNRELFKHA